MLEVCIDSLESAHNAIHGGADEIEVCSSLGEGGLTPSPGLVRKILALPVRPKINVMIRCRPGSDFCYSPLEMDTMLADVEFYKEMGVDRFVFGCLTNTQEVDKEKCRKIVDCAKPIPVTFHRAFDMCSDPLTAVKDIISLDFDRLLTSGQQTSAAHNSSVSLITKLIEMFGDEIQIMPGAGLNSKNVVLLIETGCKIVHSSCKKPKPLPYIENNVIMGATESQLINVTDENFVRELKETIYQNFNK